MFFTKHRLLFIVLLLFFASGLVYLQSSPLWTPPDEERHFAYLEYIAQHHSLPDYKTNADIGMAFHPPLYYVLASFFCNNDSKLLAEEIYLNEGPGFIEFRHPADESLFPYAGKARSSYLIRFFSLLLGAMTVALIYFMALLIWPDEKLFAAVTALFVGMVPQFMYVSTSISNDNLSTTLSTASIYMLLYV
jgi:4-amino-4-deoxy-L-arabinose transferase-like glycosyltransferase